MTKIPIRNLFYMLCYAWGNLEAGGKVNVGQDNFTDTVNLFARLMSSALGHATKMGLWREYHTEESAMSCIRGKVLINPTLKAGLLQRGQVICSADEFDLNNLPNQILKATIGNLLKSDLLESNRRDDLHQAHRLFTSVEDIRLHSTTFRKVNIHRQNGFYGILMNLSELIFDLWLPEKGDAGSFEMQELVQDEVRMRAIFQDFLFEFYNEHQIGFDQVKAERFDWNAQPITEDALKHIPTLNTDISLLSPKRTVIIDAKYTPNLLTNTYWGNERFNPGHLFQINAYLANKASRIDHKPEGMLIYPSSGNSFRSKFQLLGHTVSVNTVDLSEPWETIHQELLQIISGI